MLPSCERVVRIPRDKYLPAHNRKVQVPQNPTTIGGHLRRRRLQLRIFQSEAARKLGGRRAPCRKHRELIKKLNGIGV
jgi:hypothetical protein